MEAPTLDVTKDAVTEFAATGISFQDYLKRFEGQRSEWLMGNVILMTNNMIHQEILSFLDNLLRLYLGMTKLGKLLLAGVSMHLSDDEPAREPDLMIVLNEHRHRIQATHLEGTADICVEIVSPESVKRDYGAKFAEYEAAGVREYWRIDPMRKQTDFFVLRDVDGEMRYQRLPLDAQGRQTSTLLPGFALDPTVFWREELPDGMELVELAQGMAGG